MPKWEMREQKFMRSSSALLGIEDCNTRGVGGSAGAGKLKGGQQKVGL